MKRKTVTRYNIHPIAIVNHLNYDCYRRSLHERSVAFAERKATLRQIIDTPILFPSPTTPIHGGNRCVHSPLDANTAATADGFQKVGALPTFVLVEAGPGAVSESNARSRIVTLPCETPTVAFDGLERFT